MKLKDVNTTDIADAIRLGCATMQRVFNADDGGIPFFDARARPEVRFGFESPYTEAHVPGRHLAALLTAEEVTGLRPEEEAIAGHRRAAFFSLGGTLPLPLCREQVGGPLVVFADHNVREALYGLYALVRYRGDDQARELAERCIAAVQSLWHPARGWDTARFKALGIRLETRTFIWGLARAIGPLVKFYRATGHPPALELALTLAEKATTEYFHDDGAYDLVRFGTHTHSATSTLSSLAQLADLTRDSTLMRRVLAFYDGGLNTIRDELGWVIEHAGSPSANPDRGECNNTGDVAETALLLGRWGLDRCYHDVERIVRGHLLPAQLRDVSFIAEPSNPKGFDTLRDVAARMRGAFGFPAPYGHQPVGLPLVQFCLDIVGGAVLSLCEVWRDAVCTDETGHHVNLLFDRDTDAVCVRSPYTCGRLEVTVRRSAPLWIRLPPWVDRRRLVVCGGDAPRFFGDRLFLASPPVGSLVTVEFPLAEQALALRHPTRTIRVRLRGDEVAAMDSFGADLTFFNEFGEAGIDRGSMAGGSAKGSNP